MNEPNELIFPYPARVLRVSQERSPELLALAADSNAFDPSVFGEKSPFFWTAEVSNSGVDAYFTRMLPSTLANFAADAKAGVSFLNSHRHNELPFGRSLDGRVEDTGKKQRVLVDFFTLPGLNLNGVSTDNFIEGIRSGIIKDTSVGFHGGTESCDLCGRGFWECPHIPGMTYETKGADNIIRQQVATFAIDGAHLAEVSAVYDGATPDATILKAQRLNEAGKLKPDEARTLEARYHRSLFDNKRTFAGVSVPERKKVMDLEQQFTQIREVLSLPADGDVVAEVLKASGELTRLRAIAETVTGLEEQVRTLTPQAADGVAYRNDLVSEALAEGVRALGDKFNSATYEPLLRKAPLDVIKQMKGDWAEAGNIRFPGGRATTDEGEQAPDKKTKRTVGVPNSAYKA